MEDFERFLEPVGGIGVEIDVILGRKDKEKSALKALKIIDSAD